jgi:hypothetical protein
MPLPGNTPPSLYHSPSEGMTRGGSAESDYDFNTFPEMFAAPGIPQFFPGAPFPGFTPIEVDIRTETQYFINDVETRRDSTISSSCFQPAPGSPDQMENWVQKDYYERKQESFVDELVDFNFLDFASPMIDSPAIVVEDADQYLLNYFMENIVPMIHPIRGASKVTKNSSDLVIPALQSNNAYLHCCLSIAAMHLKTSGTPVDEAKLSEDITNHMVVAINEICQSLGSDTNLEQVLEAALAMISLRTLVGSANDSIEVPWDSHFGCVTEVISRLNLPVTALATPTVSSSLSQAAVVDILGATMRGRTPSFANLYREKNIANASLGLSELTGCNDAIFYLISEIACLEDLKANNHMDAISLCMHINGLGTRINETERPGEVAPVALDASGNVLDHAQLTNNVTALYRIAARIYLCSLLPDFNPRAENVRQLIMAFTSIMAMVPQSAHFDRTLTWPLLIAGSVAQADGPFHAAFNARLGNLGQEACLGALGRVADVLRELWLQNGPLSPVGSPKVDVTDKKQSVHWRDVMKQRGWDFLLI